MPKAPKELRDLMSTARSMGLVVEERRNGNHYKVYTEDGRFVLSLPSTPGKGGRGRWAKNLEAHLRRRANELQGAQSCGSTSIV
jgi:hypothetical protein